MPLTKALASGFVPPCIPTRAPKPPAGPDWVHEIKHDGYRLQVRRDGDTVRLFTRRGHDWTERYPAIANAHQRPAGAAGGALMVGAWPTLVHGRDTETVSDRQQTG
jgi:ATP-dependent DNA ligase